MSTLHDLITGDVHLQDYWPLDDGSGTSPVDTTGGHGSITGTPTWNPTDIPPVGGTGSVQLDGSSYITSTSEYSVPDTGSIEVWFYPPDPTTLGTPGGLHLLAGFLGGDSDSGDTQIAVGMFARYQSGNWDVILKLPVPSVGQNVESSKISTAHLTPGTWNQIVVTWNPDRGTIYINGVAAGSYLATAWFSDTDHFNMFPYTTAGFYVGGGFSGGGSTSTIYDLPGIFSNVATLYGAEWTSGNVAAHYAAGLNLEARVTSLAVEVLVSVSRRVVDVTATTDLRVGLKATEIRDAKLTSNSGIRIGSVGSGYLLPTLTASTGIRIGSAGSAAVLTTMTASTDMRIGSVGSESYLPVVTASTDIRFGVKAEDPYFLTASTGFFLGLGATAPNQKNVTATTDIRIAHRQSTSLLSTFVYVSASTGIRVGHSNVVSFTRSRMVAAVTALRIGLSATFKIGAGYLVRAATSLMVGSRGAETRDAAVSATTSMSMANGVTKGREIFVSAITGIFAASDEDDEVAQAATATTSLRIGLNASVGVGGHEASTGFRIGHLATATRGIPWRPDGLNLQPGGNLPHS